MKKEELDSLYRSARRAYLKPVVELYRMPTPCNVLEQMSIEGDVWDFEDGENL